MRELYLLTGEIHSGKTTALQKWSEVKNDVYGILTPVVNGERMFLDIYSKDIFPMEAKDVYEEVLEVGKYRFNTKSFEKASEIILLSKDKTGWLVIDEIGPLELRGKGFCNALKQILIDKNDELRLLLVIRESILEQAFDVFQLKKLSPQIITVDSGFFN